MQENNSITLYIIFLIVRMVLLEIEVIFLKKSIPVLSFIFCLLFIGTFPSMASACECAELPSVEAEFENSKAVFSGKVIDIREKGSLKGYRSKSVLFEVKNTWKGVTQSQIIITTGQGGGDCGIDFKEGEEYLVYANDSTMYGKKTLVSIICDRTNDLKSSQEDLEILGEGRAPTETIDFRDKQNGSQWFIWGGGVLVIGIIGIYLLMRRKKNK